EPGVKRWWPAGAQLTQSLGRRYAVIGMALGVSDDNAIAAPEAGTLEARLTAAGGPLFIPTHRREAPPPPGVAAMPIRPGSAPNPPWGRLRRVSCADFVGLASLGTPSSPRGAPPLTAWNAEAS